MPETLLALDAVRAGYGELVVIDGVSLELAEGGSLCGARPQRCRQDDASAHHHGLHPRRVRPHALAWSRHRPDRAASPGTPGHRLGRAGT